MNEIAGPEDGRGQWVGEGGIPSGGNLLSIGDGVSTGVVEVGVGSGLRSRIVGIIRQGRILRAVEQGVVVRVGIARIGAGVRFAHPHAGSGLDSIDQTILI